MDPKPLSPLAGILRRLSEPTRFYLVRHGESEGNVRKICQGHMDLPLTAEGRRQAALLAPWLAGKRIGAVYSSPLVRALDTARAISSAAGLGEPERVDLLKEVDTGRFSGLSMEEAKQLYPEHYERFRHESWEGVPSAERSSDLARRALAAWELLAETAQTRGIRDIVAVSHGGLIQWLFRASFGHFSWMPLMTTGNCAVFMLEAVPTSPGHDPFAQWRYVDHRVGDSRATAQVF
jgi:broad specificity phosphatase PhoE